MSNKELLSRMIGDLQTMERVSKAAQDALANEGEIFAAVRAQEQREIWNAAIALAEEILEGIK